MFALGEKKKVERIGIISYDYKHLKTQQVLDRLMLDTPQKRDISIFALPFYPRSTKTIRFAHRPNQFTGDSIFDIANRYGIAYKKCMSDIEIDDGCDLYLLTGAGILSKSAIRGKYILNCHPGIIPLTRGLDAFKWAIVECYPMGNTLHFIDDQVDAGTVVAVKETPLYSNDTLCDFAHRHYTAEIDMLANFELHLNLRENKFHGVSDGLTHKRMSIREEAQLENRFMEYKKRYALKEDS